MTIDKTDDTIESKAPETEVQADSTPEVDYKALYEDTKKQLDTVAAHKDKLYAETKAAKEQRKQAETEAARIAEEKALKEGEFENLWKTAKQEKEDLAKQINDIKQANRNEKIQVSSLRIANELADGDNVELLSEFIQRNLANLADDNGALSAEVLESVKQEFKLNSKFKALLRGSKSTGGGANGQSSPTGESSMMKRDAFEKLNPIQKMDYMKSGGRLKD